MNEPVELAILYILRRSFSPMILLHLSWMFHRKGTTLPGEGCLFQKANKEPAKSFAFHRATT